MTAAQITSLMQQDFPLLDCHCGHHCVSRTGLSTHLVACPIPRPDDWDLPPRHPIAHHDDNPPALAPPHFAPVAVDPPLSYSDLLSQFRQPVYKTHHTWRAPMATIVEDILHKAISEDEDTATLNIAGLHILPGLLALHVNKRKCDNLLSPISWLRSIIASPDYATEIIRFARTEAAKPRRPVNAPSAWVQPKVESLRVRTVKLMGDGRIRAASNNVTTIGGILEGKVFAEPLSGAALQQRIDLLHPANNHMDLLPPTSEDPDAEPLQITPDQLRQHLYRLSFDSAAGNTGWTNSLIYALCNDRATPGFQAGLTPPSPIISAFCALGNNMLRGTIKGAGRDLLVGARLTLIDKPDGGSRPIRIECACRRWFSAAACKVAMLVIGPHLRPLQLGGGLSHGAGIGARMGGLFLHREGSSVMSVDIENAFNSTRHRTIYDSLCLYFPPLIPFFRFKYEEPSPMRNNSGNIVAHTRTGVGQGDPWGSLFFELAIQPSLLRTQEALKTIEIEMNLHIPGRKGIVIAFEDDTSAMGDTRAIVRLAPLVKDIFAQDGFHVKVSKSTITGRDIETIASVDPPPDGFLLSREGTTMLGVPIGTREYRRSLAESKLRGMQPSTAALQVMGPRIATSLLLHSINLRPLFLMSSDSNPDDIVEYARAFDTHTVSTVATILHTATTDMLDYRCFLPPQLGGLGLIRHAEMSTEKAQIVQRLAFSEFISKYYPSEYINNTETNTLVNIQLGKYEGLVDKTELTQEIMESLTLLSSRSKLSVAKRAAETTSSAEIQEALQTESLSKAAWMLSCSSSGINFAKSTRGIQNERLFSAEQFRCALRSKLGAGPIEDAPHLDFTCQCTTIYRPREDPFHGCRCNINASYRQRRHNEIQRVLKAYIRKCLDLPDHAVRLEALAGTTAETVLVPSRRVTADISVTIGPETLWVDVSVVDPGSRNYIERYRSNEVPDAAAKAMETSKRNHYGAVTDPLPLPPASVIPFVLETSGRLGPSALGFIQRISGTHTFLRTQLLNEIQFICAIYTGSMLEATREWMRANPHKWLA